MFGLLPLALWCGIVRRERAWLGKIGLQTEGGGAERGLDVYGSILDFHKVHTWHIITGSV